MVRADGCDLRDNHAEVVARKRLDRGVAEAQHRIDRGRRARSRRPVAMAARSVMPDVVCDSNPPVESRLPLSKMMCTRFFGRYRASVASVPRFIRTEPSPSRTTTRSWAMQRKAQANRRRQPHRVLQVEEVVPVAEVVEFLRARAHDRHHRLSSARDRASRCTRRASRQSSIRSRVSSSATGDSELCENV